MLVGDVCKQNGNREWYFILYITIYYTDISVFQYRGEAEHNNIGSIQQSTSELIIDSSSHPVETSKPETSLPHTFLELENHPKETPRHDNQRTIYNSDINNPQTVKYCTENKNVIHSDSDKKNPNQDQTAKSNKDTNVRCSERSSILRDSRDSDSDENDDIHRSHVPSECLMNSSNSSQFTKNPILGRFTFHWCYIPFSEVWRTGLWNAYFCFLSSLFVNGEIYL